MPEAGRRVRGIPSAEARLVYAFTYDSGETTFIAILVVGTDRKIICISKCEIADDIRSDIANVNGYTIDSGCFPEVDLVSGKIDLGVWRPGQHCTRRPAGRWRGR